MSVNSFIIRLVATRLLRGATWAGNQVLNSPVEPISEVLNLAGGNPLPVIGVFVSESSSDPDGRDVGSRNNKIDLGIFIYLPPRLKPNGDDSLVIDNQGAAMALDLVTRQIMNALRASASPWRPIWERFVVKFTSHEAKPVLIELADKVRIAAAEISLSCNILGEPPVGEAIYGPWQEFDTLLRNGSSEDMQTADLIKGAIEYRTDMPSWEVVRAAMAWSEQGIRVAGLAPQDATETGEPALLTEIEQSGVDIISGPVLGPIP